MATNSRDATARRQRIAERGRDRMALITGRVQSITSSPSPPSVAQPISPKSDQLPPSEENTDPPSNKQTVSNDDANDIQPIMRKCEPIAKAEASAPASFEPSEMQSFPTTLTDQNPPISTTNRSQKSESQTHLQKTLSPTRLRPAIAASQDIRRNLSFITAMLVLLSYAGFPILGSGIIKNIVLSRPLVLLVLTNITIMAAPFLLEKVEQKENRGTSTGEVGFIDRLGKALGWVMLLQSCLSALFMDCSVYSVVVICGMSILQKLGW